MVTREGMKMGEIPLDLGTEVVNFIAEFESATSLEMLLQYQR